MKTDTTIDDLILETYADEFASNWKSFESFGWHDQPDDSELWGIWYISNRDSTLMTKSNEEVIAAEFKEFFDNDNPFVVSERHGHWACGHVDGYSIRVKDNEGNFSEPFKKMCGIVERLEEYPVLDESLYGEKEMEAEYENSESFVLDAIEDYQKDNPDSDFDPEVTDKLRDDTINWLRENDCNAMESRDDMGAYPRSEEVIEAFRGLGLIK